MMKYGGGGIFRQAIRPSNGRNAWGYENQKSMIPHTSRHFFLSFFLSFVTIFTAGSNTAGTNYTSESSCCIHAVFFSLFQPGLEQLRYHFRFGLLDMIGFCLAVIIFETSMWFSLISIVLIRPK